ncbi:hypothetical protein TNCT_392691 [Trichonephila clavata]|uniref:Uncharacterized protein n=1 Tax=Trichonephila clavata TaxID=2740835 RepID=A0A8X6JEE2_TRICU|nr:hypothetical protein TNCT_392691 [Trichonephila clavata]
MAPISSNQWFHWLRKLSQFRWAVLPSFFSLVMAQEEDRKAIGRELESEMVILSQQQMDDAFPRSQIFGCLYAVFRGTVVFGIEA